MDCSPPDSSVHGIFQASMLEWGAISSSRASSQRSNPHRLHWQAGSLPAEPLGKPQINPSKQVNKNLQGSLLRTGSSTNSSPRHARLFKVQPPLPFSALALLPCNKLSSPSPASTFFQPPCLCSSSESVLETPFFAGQITFHQQCPHYHLHENLSR